MLDVVVAASTSAGIDTGFAFFFICMKSVISHYWVPAAASPGVPVGQRVSPLVASDGIRGDHH